MRLIDADAVMRLIPMEEIVARMAIASVPTADVVERKVGKWIDPAAENVYRCSVCEEYTTLEVPRLFYHYCPNCGAFMKGEDDAEVH